MRSLGQHFKTFIAMLAVFCVIAPLIAGAYYLVFYPLYVLSGRAEVTIDQLLYFPTISVLFFVLLPGLLLTPFVLGVIPAFITCVLSFLVYIMRGYVNWWLVCLFAFVACAAPLSFDGLQSSTNLITKPIFVLSGFMSALTICWWRRAFGFNKIIR
ncbi:MAG: hypothetical protein ABJ081_00655 [Hyphomicrobiales bacterium]